MQFPVILGILNNPLASANFQVTKTDVLILSNKTNALLWASGIWWLMDYVFGIIEQETSW